MKLLKRVCNKQALFKKIAVVAMIASLCAACLSGCTLGKQEIVTLTMWHVYGEQADSPMDALVEEFNSTVGKEQNIIINVTATSNSSNIGPALEDSQNGKPGAKDMPDLFFCHPSNAARLGTDNLVDWNRYFTEKELSEYNKDFLEEGVVNGSLAVFPVSKSTHMLFINGSMFQRFSKDTGVTESDLATWEGFFQAAERFYEWSGGKTFCAFDYIMRAVELSVLSKNAGENLYTDDGWYDFGNEEWKTEWNHFADALVKGYISVSDLYSNTQVMTGETLCGLGSCAAILYYNDMVTYSDNTSEPMNLIVLPMPVNKGKPALDTQAGTGLSAYKTTDEKAEAAAVFAKWLTESERNLKFTTDAGYMPVTNKAFDAMQSHDFDKEAYQTLYKALEKTYSEYTFLKEPSFDNYFPRVKDFYEIIREKQDEWKERFSKGEGAESLKNECWEFFKGV